MPFRKILILVLCAVAMIVVDRPVQAQSDEEKQRAFEFYTEGQRLYDAGLFAAAIENFSKAHEIMPHPVNLYNIARAYENLGDGANCVKFYDEYVALHKKRENNRDPSDIVAVRASISKCRLLLKSEVSVGSDPIGAKVYIDNKDNLLGQTPFQTTLEPGRYKLFLVLDGHVPFEETFEVRAGEPVKLFFKLEKFQRVGRLRVKTNVRDAALFIDGRNIGLTPYRELITLDEGRHQIAVRKDDYTSFAQEVDIVVNQDHEVVAELFLQSAPMTWKGYVGWTSLVTGALLAGGGVVAGTQVGQYFEGSKEADEWKTLQKVGYGVGGGLFGLGVLLLILEATDTEAVRPGDVMDPYAHREQGPTVTPILGINGAGGILGADIRF
jgi:hypothetical protein